MAFTGFINLTTGEVDIHETNLELQRLYLGGRGLGAALLYQRVDPTIKPFDKEELPHLYGRAVQWHVLASYGSHACDL